MAAPAVVNPEAPRYLLINGLTGTESLAEYESRGGYSALGHVVERDNPRDVIGNLESSGLRGRGGANFPTHTKWEMVRAARPGPRYVICNGGEHEPGSLKDRELMTHYPHTVLEGLLIAAHTVGAHKAYVYITEDQAQALTSIRTAIDELEEAGYRQGGNKRFHCELVCIPGPSTYVSGEETAAINAIEGREAKPRKKPPYPTVEGLFSAPTLVNNSETLAHVPTILGRGAAWFRQIGTPGSPGTVLVTLTNGVNRPGVYEVAYGTPIRAILDNCGGGTLGGRSVKAILPGGPSLPFLSAAALDAPFEHESLKQAGSSVGCGAIRIWLEGECMVEPILKFAEFFAQAQCGQCAPCRMETSAFVLALRQIANGTGSSNQIRQMEKVAAFAGAKGGLCSLIPMAAATVFSGLRLFESDFRNHMEHRGCNRAGAPISV
jgi:NADH-quinone oxidoreductase subunit F